MALRRERGAADGEHPGHAVAAGSLAKLAGLNLKGVDRV